MAREQQHREDLLAEATALVERARIAIPGLPMSVVFGFRRDGSASFYFGEDPAYHFNSRAELRRAYVDGLLYKAQRGQLIALRRTPSATAIELVRHELDHNETHAQLERMTQQLSQLRHALEARDYKPLGQVPADGDPHARAQMFLDRLTAPIVIADSPHAG